MTKQANRTPAQEEGFVVVVLLTLLIPMLLVVGAFSVTMNSRTQELVVEMDEERALMAAEAGVDHFIYQAQTQPLTTGQTSKKVLSNDLWFESVATYLKTDDEDNDNDGKKDAADEDEDVYQIIVTGHSRNTTRRLAAYLGPTATLAALSTTPMAIQNPSVTLDLRGTSLVSGEDMDMDGNLTGNVVAGMSIAPPGTVLDLDAELTGSERNQVIGAGWSLGNPSLAQATSAVDLDTLVPQLQNAAGAVLTSSQYTAFDFGNGQKGLSQITYREGDVKFAGKTQGAGILVVTGDLELKGNFRFDGLIIVLGTLNNSGGTADVFGSIIVGPSGGLVQMKGTMNVHYSADAMKLANSGAAQYVAFNGWQELSK